jgi:hypothetical protein
MDRKEEIEYMNSCMTEYYESLNSLDRRGYIKSMLKRDIMKVVFTKVDDTTREMYCTLQDEFVPEHKKYYFASEGSREKNMGTLSVFDLEKGDWRSFRIESITDFGIVHEEIYNNTIKFRPVQSI